MTHTETVAVETLTAEVRVLMVGSRQVTLSVARQLDSYELQDDESIGFMPFGRIRTGARGEKFVRCKRDDKDAEWFPIAHECPNQHGTCGHWKQYFNGKMVCGTAERLELREYDYQWIGRRAPTRNLIVVNAFENDLDDKSDPESWAWKDLPLIVLAGLK